MVDIMKKIYKIEADFDIFRFLLPTEDTVKLKFNKIKGQKLNNEYVGLEYFLFVDPRKRKDKRRMNFNVSCWGSSELICDYETKLKFELKFGDLVEIFPIKTDLDRDFFYVNLLNVIEAQNHNLKPVYNMQNDTYTKKVEFIKKNIGDEIFFRDKIQTSSYFVTQEFIDWVNENNITGMRFEFQGFMV